MKDKLKIEKVSLKKIIVDQHINPRIMIDSLHVAELAKLIKEKVELKAITVYEDKNKKKLYLVDGFHRYKAHEQAKKEKILCEIKPGRYYDAYINACGVNAYHGKPLNNEDKRRIVTRLLEDKEESEWSDCTIAKKCGVSQPFVSNIRKDLESQNGYESNKKRKAVNGTVVDTSNIGKNKNDNDSDKKKSKKITESDYENGLKGLSKLQNKLQAIKDLLEQRKKWKTKDVKSLKGIKNDAELLWERVSEFLTMIEEYL